MCPIFLDEVFCDLLQGRAPSQQPNVTEKLRGEWQWGAEEISSFHSKIVYFPAAKLSAKQSSSHSEMCHSDKCPSFANDSALLSSWGRLDENYNGP